MKIEWTTDWRKCELDPGDGEAPFQFGPEGHHAGLLPPSVHKLLIRAYERGVRRGEAGRTTSASK